MIPWLRYGVSLLAGETYGEKSHLRWAQCLNLFTYQSVKDLKGRFRDELAGNLPIFMTPETGSSGGVDRKGYVAILAS